MQGVQGGNSVTIRTARTTLGGPIGRALEADLSRWGASDGVLAHVAREIAARLDWSGLDVDLSRELRMLVKAIRETAGTSPSEVERFLAEIQADEFGGR